MSRLAVFARVFTVLVVGSFATAQQPTVEQLTPAQIERLEMGEPVQVLEPSAGPWPRSIVFQLIEATPEECAAVLSDYELQSSYIPRMKSSRIVRRSGADTDVQYVIDVPIYPDERSVSRQRVVATLNEYQVLWQTVTDSLSRGSVTTGSARFKPMMNRRTSRSGTLMIHDQQVVPSSVFARVSFVRNKAIEASRDAAAAIRRQVERERASEPERVRLQVAQLRSVVTRPPP